MEGTEIKNILSSISAFTLLKEIPEPIQIRKKLKSFFLLEFNLLDKSTNLLIGFPKKFPLALPEFFIPNPKNFEFIPHIEEDGKICYTDSDFINISYERPKDLIEDSFELVKQLLEKGLKKENFDDFSEEFNAYWGKLPNIETILSNVKIEQTPMKIKLQIGEKAKFFVSDTNEYRDSISRFVKKNDKGWQIKNALYIPLNLKKRIIPPRYGTTLTIEVVRKLIQDDLDDDFIKKKLKHLLTKQCKQVEYVLFSFKSPKGNDILFGIKFSIIKNTSCHPLLQENFEGKVIPVNLTRLDKEYIFARGSKDGKISSKKGLIIGCGSVGGFLAEELVRSGFLTLTLIDDDLISLENCYRHCCGYIYLEQNKSSALKSKLELYFPHCNITSYKDKIENILETGSLDFKSFDYIFVATGNVTINRYLNKYILTNYRDIPLLYLWNEPYGIGGHCLISNISKYGCYECLYSNENIFNSASFANSEQPKPFTKNLAGCAGIFTPYGSMDSRKTVLTGVQTIIDYFKGEVHENILNSWKGNPETFISEGFNLSPRYNMTETQLSENNQNFHTRNCQECNKKN